MQQTPRMSRERRLAALAMSFALAGLAAACGRNEVAPAPVASAAGSGVGGGAPTDASIAAPAGGPGAAAPPPASVAAAQAAPPAQPTAGTSANPAGSAQAGQSVFASSCLACHGAGVAGAPRLGDKADWEPRLAQGMEVLYRHSIEGYTGRKGVMPPKGGNTSLSDADVRSAVDYMVAQVR